MLPERLGKQGQDPGLRQARGLPHALQAPGLECYLWGGPAPAPAGRLSAQRRGRHAGSCRPPCWELQGAFPGPYLWKDNRQPKANRDRRIGEGSRSQGKIHSRQQERGKEWVDLDEEGRRTELRQAIGALQIEDPGREEPSGKNLHRQEVSRTPSLGLRADKIPTGETAGEPLLRW